MRILEHPTRNLFFTGKGGVGKTTIASAAAVQLAELGRSVLLVSTDPASNLDEVLATPLGSQPTVVAGVSNLWAMNIDPELAAHEYRERMVAPYRGVLPEAAVQSMEEQYSGSCTLEIAAFDEFARLLGDQQATAEFDHIVFDTAPTGHTLRLLTLPSAWSSFIETNTSGTSCLGPLAGLQAQQILYRKTVESLSDERQTTLVLVARPEPSALQEAERTSHELRELGVGNQHFVINGVFRSHDSTDSVAVAMQHRCDQAILNMPSGVARLPRTMISLVPRGFLGVDELRQIAEHETSATRLELPLSVPASIPFGLAGSLPMDVLIDELAEHGHGVVLTMGKGGVGKTTIAAAVAVALADRGFQVNLSTTDPAAHLAATIGADKIAGLTLSRIDPVTETEAYRDEVMRNAGANLDKQGKALLAEDLRSPCTEEIAVFRALARSVADGKDGFVVLDTAPTGHTILLLDSALAYHRQVARQASHMPESVQNLLPRLRNPDYTRVLVVTVPESTPVHEAAKLQDDLRRADIEPFGWIVNQALGPLAITDPVLRARQASEHPFIEEVLTRHAKRSVIVPWQVEPPTGVRSLRELVSESAPAK